MKNPIKKPSFKDRLRGYWLSLWRHPYTLIALLAYLLIAAMVMLYLASSPTYRSHTAWVLPGSGSSSKVVLDEVGQASQQTTSPFGNSSFNPRVNYKEVIRSLEVRQNAADSLGMSLAALEGINIELTEQTTIIKINIGASRPELAQEKLWALYDAFQLELDRLRADESLRRDESIRSVLAQYEQRLVAARQEIVDFQQESLIVSIDQFAQLEQALAEVKSRQWSLHADSQNLGQFVNQLSTDLGVSPSLAGQAFILQSDAEFRGYIRELDSASAKMAEYRSRWGNKHPMVKAEQSRFEVAKSSLHERSTELIGVATADALYRMDLQASPGSSSLFSSLLDAYARQQGQVAELNELRLIEARLDDQLKLYSREVAELERLEREHQLAEAVYTQAAARLEAGKSDVFASYPVVQMLSVPSLPGDPHSPRTLLAIIAGVMGSLFVTIALVVICQRERLVQLLLKRPSFGTH